MIFDLAMTAALLAVGNFTFRHFEQRTTWWRRVLKAAIILAVTAGISNYYGRRGVLIAWGVAMLPVIFVHAIWLPRHGVNGWTGEPRDKYYALRDGRPRKPNRARPSF